MSDCISLHRYYYYAWGLGDIESSVRREFNFSWDVGCQLWSKTSVDEELLSNPYQTLLEVGLCSGKVRHLRTLVKLCYNTSVLDCTNQECIASSCKSPEEGATR